MANKTSETVKKAARSAAEAVTVDKLMEMLGKENTQEALKKLYGKIFNIGPNDEAIVDNAINEIEEDLNERVKIRKEVEKLFAEMRKKEYSVEWFKAVLVKKNRDWNAGKGKSPAAQTIEAVLQGKTFKQKVDIATSELMKKTVISRVKKGWKAVAGKDGKIYVLIDPSKFKNFVTPKIETAKADFKRGSIQTLKWFWGSVGVLVIVFFLFVLFSN